MSNIKRIDQFYDQNMSFKNNLGKYQCFWLAKTQYCFHGCDEQLCQIIVNWSLLQVHLCRSVASHAIMLGEDNKMFSLIKCCMISENKY